MSSINSSLSSKMIFGLSVFGLLYFGLLNYWVSNPPSYNGVIRAFGELLTIPLILFPFAAIGYSVVCLVKKENIYMNIAILLCNIITLLVVFKPIS